MNELSAIIAGNLRELRHKHRLNQSEMAEKIGVAVRSYQNYEGSLRIPKADVVSNICRVFNITQTELFTKGMAPEKQHADSGFTAEDLISIGEKLSRMSPKSRELILKQIDQILLAEEMNRKKASKQA